MRREDDPTIAEAPLGPRRSVVLVDTDHKWVRQPSDLVGVVLALVGIVLLALLAVYATSTTMAVQYDVRFATRNILEKVLFLPVNALEGLLSFVLPVIIIVDIVVKRRWRTLAIAVAASGASIGLANLIRWAGDKWWPRSPFVDQYLDSFLEQSYIALVPYVALVTALLTVAGTMKGSVVVRIGWWLTWIVLVLSVLQGNQSLAGALITMLLGVFCGMLVRYIAGGEPNRAVGLDFVKLVRRAGVDVETIVRIDDTDGLRAWTVTTSSPIGYSDRFGLSQLRDLLDKQISEDTAEAADLIAKVNDLSADEAIVVAPLIDPSDAREQLASKYSVIDDDKASRHYLARDVDGVVHHLIVLDADRSILGVLNTTWAKIRLKTTIHHEERTLEETAEQMVLMSIRTERSDITPATYEATAGLAESIVVVHKALDAPLLSTVDDLTDEQMDALWHSLRAAHREGISNGNIQASAVALVDGHPYIVAWQDGSILSSETLRRIDLAQMVAMLATIVGYDRAVESLKRTMPLDQIVSLAPLLQTAIMPGLTRAYFKGNKEFQKLRDALTDAIPEGATSETVEIKRFSGKTILTVTVGVVALYVLLGSMNWEEVVDALKSAQPWWMVAAFATGLLTYVGAAITLKAYTPEKLPMGESILVQVAASVVTLVAPAGIGPAALNLRFIQKKGVSTAAALATVSVVQVGQFLVTVLLLLVFSLFSGDLSGLSMPSPSVLAAIGLVIAAIAALFLIRPLRQWVITKIKPTLNQIGPRLIWLATHPTRLLYGFGGSLLMTIGFVACFGFSLKAFGYELSLLTLAVTYLLSNSVGSIVPSPGGIGPVEAALTGGLVIAGIPTSVALSTAVLYRLLTFWGRVPLGWIALKIATKKDIV